MTQEWLLKTLVSLGLSQTEAEIYVLLSTEGSKRARSIANALTTERHQIYRSLRNLKGMQVIIVSSNQPKLFSAVPFDEVLMRFVEVKKDQAEDLQNSRDRLLSRWRTFIEEKKGV